MMPKTPLIRCALITLLYGALPVYAQNSRMMNKLAEKPAEQILVFAIDRPNLTQIIEATAWKMNYDSVLVNSAQNKILVFRGFPSSPLQYRILLGMTQRDSAVELASQSFWLLPPDSIPRYNKSMQNADHDLQKLFLCALLQEIALHKGEPLFEKSLPEKTFSQFILRNLLNPGLASWYIMKDHPRVTKKTAVGWSLFFGLLDAGYIAFGFTVRGEQQEGSASPINWSNQQFGFFGAATSRLAMTVGYFVDRDYQELRKSGYYFPKIAAINFDSKYTRHLRQPEQAPKP
jgi:hypothetical protein